jgi:ankyrin repeat protein
VYPNPQDALPLPPRPSLEQYKKRAKDLVKACRSGDPAAIRVWAARWVDTDARHIDEIEQFARSKLAGSCALTAAQFVIARAHGFESWPKMAKHLETLARANSAVSAFEAAADAIVSGDLGTLERLLREQPDLIRARSTREHRATLLHYVSANGVEGYRQKTPKNAAAVARLLLRAGAEVDAEADVYGGGCTTLGLVATSQHPLRAGVQNDLIDVMLEHGARLDLRGGGHNHGLVTACLRNGCPGAADYLASLGAPLDLEAAAGVGRLDVVKGFFEDKPRAVVPPLHVVERGSGGEDGFSQACGYGHPDVVEFLLGKGMKVDARLSVVGAGHTGLHVAAYAAQVEVVQVLLRHGAPVNVKDETWGTPPLVWALHAWSEDRAAPPERYTQVVAMLVAAGAVVDPELLGSEKVRADPKMLSALSGRAKGE